MNSCITSTWDFKYWVMYLWYTFLAEHEVGDKITLSTVHTAGHFIFCWNQSLRPWSETKKPDWDLINAKSKVMLSFGLRLESQTKLRAETKVSDQSLVVWYQT